MSVIPYVEKKTYQTFINLKGFIAMQRMALLIFGLILTLLMGCAPKAKVYYRSSVEIESTREKQHSEPTEKYVYFDMETKNKTLSIRGYEIPKNQALKIRGHGETYSTSEGEFSEGQYVVFGNWRKIGYKNEDFFIAGSGNDEKVKSRNYYGEEHHLHEYNSYYKFGAVFPKQNGDNFDVFFPPLIIDGEEIQLPVLHIEKIDLDEN